MFKGQGNAVTVDSNEHSSNVRIRLVGFEKHAPRAALSSFLKLPLKHSNAAFNSERKARLYRIGHRFSSGLTDPRSQVMVEQ